MRRADLLVQSCRLYIPDAGAPVLELVNAQYADLSVRGLPKDVALTLTEDQVKAFSALAAR